MPLDPDTFPGYYFRGERLKETCTRALSHPAVSTVIPGMRRPEHVDENCAVPDAPTLTSQELQTLKTHAWPRNFYE
jgi:predicted aldo/keto reductase-like oxidoreductase